MSRSALNAKWSIAYVLLVWLGFAPQAVAQVFTAAGNDSREITRPEARKGSVATDVELRASAVAALPDGSFVAQDLDGPRLVHIDASGHVARVMALGGRRATSDETEDVAIAADGSVFFIDANTVRRIGRDGIIATVAGNGSVEASGDGGIALAAGMAPVAVAPVAGGALLIAGNDRVRRVGADATITTVAGTGAPGTSGDGGAATAARLTAAAVSALPGGGFLVAGSGSVRRVTPDGRITTVAGTAGPPARSPTPLAEGVRATAVRLGSVHDVVALRDGAFAFADEFGIRRVDGRGRLTTVTGARTSSWGQENAIYTDGMPPRRALLDAPDIDVARDGSLLVATRARVAMIAGAAATERFALALPRENLRSVRAHRIVVISTAAAQARVDILRRGRTVVQRTRRIPAGRSVLSVPIPARAAVYQLRVRARTADGRVATDRLNVLPSTKLPMEVARGLVWEYVSAVTSNVWYSVRGCHQVARGAVACRWNWRHFPVELAHERFAITVILRPDGSLVAREQPLQGPRLTQRLYFELPGRETEDQGAANVPL